MVRASAFQAEDAGSIPVICSKKVFKMTNFIYNRDENEFVCNRCGSGNVVVRPGMMVDRITCLDCGNEDYIS